MRRPVCGVALRAIICAVAACIAFSGSSASAEDFQTRLSDAGGNISLSSLKVHVGVESGIITDDNIYNLSTEEKTDVINYLMPGISLALDTDHALFRGGYSATIYQYRDYTEEDYTAQNAYFSYNYASESGVYITLNESYELTKEPRSEENTVRSQHTLHNLSGTLGYEFPGKKLALEGTVSRMVLDYDADNDDLSRDDDSYAGRLYWRFLPKSSFFVQYDYGSIDYYESQDERQDPDSYSNTWSGGFKWDATANLSGEIRGGYSDKIYTYGGHLDSGHDTWVMAADLTYAWSQTTKVYLRGARGFNETTSAGDATHSASDFYINTMGEMEITTRFFERLDLGLKGGVASAKYEVIDQTLDARRDRTRYWNASLAYNFNSYVSSGLTYDQRKVNSNVDLRDEKHHIYKFFLAVML